MEGLRTCRHDLFWWQFSLLLHASPHCCVYSKRMCIQHQPFWSLLLLQGESHSGLRSLLSAEFPTNKGCSTLWVIWTACAHPMHRLSEVSLLSLCSTAYRNPADRSLPGRGFEAGSWFSCTYFNIHKHPYGLLPWLGKGVFVSLTINWLDYQSRSGKKLKPKRFSCQVICSWSRAILKLLIKY